MTLKSMRCPAFQTEECEVHKHIPNDNDDEGGRNAACDCEQPDGNTLVLGEGVGERLVGHAEEAAVPIDLVDEVEYALRVSGGGGASGGRWWYCGWGWRVGNVHKQQR